MKDQIDRQKARQKFGSVLKSHIVRGTSPHGNPLPWNYTTFGKKIGASSGSVRRWAAGDAVPLRQTFETTLEVLFGASLAQIRLEKDSGKFKSAVDLIDCYNAMVTKPIELSRVNEFEGKSKLEQIPAAYRFGIHDNKIDAMPEMATNIDSIAARDLYTELKSKAIVLNQRMSDSNADLYACRSSERFLQALEGPFEDVRPGVVLSRIRTLEATRAAFSTEEGKELIFPDALAIINDVCLSGQDFLATYPIVRAIERERLALDIERSFQLVNDIRAQTVRIKAAAAKSHIVSSNAIKALAENEFEIQAASTVDLAADLVADEILVTRNFVGESIRAFVKAGVSIIGDVWYSVKGDLEVGAKTAARMLPPLALIALITDIAGPVAGLASLLRGDLFKTVHGAITQVQSQKRKTKQTTNNKLLSENEILDVLKLKRDSLRLLIELGHFEAATSVRTENNVISLAFNRRWLKNALKAMKELAAKDHTDLTRIN